MKKLDNKTIEDAFDDIKLICDNAQFDEEFSIYEEYQEQFDVVEDALNELHERREMMQRFNEACVPSVIDDDTYKKAKALDIIKKKQVNMFGLLIAINEGHKEMYNNNYHKDVVEKLTQEEFDFLKEVLL